MAETLSSQDRAHLDAAWRDYDGAPDDQRALYRAIIERRIISGTIRSITTDLKRLWAEVRNEKTR